MRGKEAQMRRSKSIRNAKNKGRRGRKKIRLKGFPCRTQEIFYPCLAWKKRGLDFFWILVLYFLFLFWI
jgi:hypothetical protein